MNYFDYQREQRASKLRLLNEDRTAVDSVELKLNTRGVNQPYHVILHIREIQVLRRVAQLPSSIGSKKSRAGHRLRRCHITPITQAIARARTKIEERFAVLVAEELTQ